LQAGWADYLQEHASEKKDPLVQRWRRKKPLNWTVSKTENSRKRCFGTFATMMQKKHSNGTLSKTETSRKSYFGTFATLMKKKPSNLTLSKTETSRKTWFGTVATRRTQNIRTGRCSKYSEALIT
jgi:hypothetical protein